MTPGQTITLIEIMACAAIAAFAWSRGRGDVLAATALCLCAVVLMRVFKATMPDDLHFAAWGALWVTAGGWLIRAGIFGVGSLPVALAGGAFVASGLCYAVADWRGAETVFLAPIMVVADVAVFVGLSLLLAGATNGKRGRILGHRGRVARALVGAHRGRGAGVASVSGVGGHGETDSAGRCRSSVHGNSEAA
jgi:hypothetical protein